MDMIALVIAVLALGISAATLWWQYHTWKRERALDVSVKLHDVTSAQKESVEGHKVTTYGRKLEIVVINKSAFPVKVVGATVVHAGAAQIGSYFSHAQPLIASRDAEHIDLERELFPNVHPGDSIEAWVELSTG